MTFVKETILPAYISNNLAFESALYEQLHAKSFLTIPSLNFNESL